ncbi:MAG TPA: tetratricopeptide repeat-containing serine protease family protein [Stellaceae bacterium]
MAAAPPEAFDAFKRNDYAAVLRVCEAPAKAGDSVCQDMLGVLYSEGHGVARDQATAFHWFQLAAAQGNATAEYNLALAFERGEGVAKDIAEAEKWYAKSAAAGVPYAQWRLGAIAIDLHNDWKSGVKWLRPAAAQGLTGAQALLGSAYERGLGVKKNEKLAAKWYETAADHGYAPAQSSLAGLYERGAGVDQDFKESYFWYAVALRDPKDPSAKQDAEGLKRVAAKLSAADVGDAAEIAKDWKPEEEVVGSKSRRTASSRSRGPRLRATGTGFYIAHDGSLITNNHVVAECTSMRISDGGDGIPAKVVAVDPDRDWRCSKHPSPSMPWLHSDPIRAASARISWLSAFPSADF